MMGYKHAFYNPFYCMENTLYDSYRRPGACWGPVVRNQCIGIDAKHRSVGGSPTSTRIAWDKGDRHALISPSKFFCPNGFFSGDLI